MVWQNNCVCSSCDTLRYKRAIAQTRVEHELRPQHPSTVTHVYPSRLLECEYWYSKIGRWNHSLQNMFGSVSGMTIFNVSCPPPVYSVQMALCVSARSVVVCGRSLSSVREWRPARVDGRKSSLFVPPEMFFVDNQGSAIQSENLEHRQQTPGR